MLFNIEYKMVLKFKNIKITKSNKKLIHEYYNFVVLRFLRFLSMSTKFENSSSKRKLFSFFGRFRRLSEINDVMFVNNVEKTRFKLLIQR